MQQLTEKYYVTKPGLAHQNQGRVWRQIQAATWPPYKCSGCGDDVISTTSGDRETNVCGGCNMLTITLWVADPSDGLESRVDQEASITATIFQRKEQRQ